MQAVMTYTVNPIGRALKGLWNGIIESQLRMGRARAAAELARMGYHEEAKDLILGKSIDEERE